ncbi:ATP-binding cassette domain-containing protein [Croceicoccus mobilis]|uniref:Macrolide ABC transporter ATP-binding protein n=1 Tax=Croceicoccus mobilis TaxID=1703339 RepID=A0A917DSD9_9SPHN|nr:ATP-binding cassette domain-containing protein [Croceicoccus mobilis]GGD65572.1 hypothetical protein GCM10010990_13840 [Croceicoccus mobilis]
MSIISLSNLRKTYQIGENVVEAQAGVSLEIEQGEFACITGPSASGKSTLMHIPACLDRASVGAEDTAGPAVAAQ